MKKFIIKILLELFINIASILLFDKWIWITINLVLLVVYANNWLKEEF